MNLNGRYNLTEGSILKSIRRLAIPMVASMALNDVLHLVNLFFVGRLGTAHVAGLTMSNVFLEIFFTLAFSSILSRSMTGAGDTFAPMVITGITLLGLRIPLCYFFSLKWGVLGIWLGMAVSNVFQGIVVSFWYYLGRWKNVVID